MNVQSTVSFRNLTNICRSLEKATGVAIPRVIDFEAERILEKCISLTPAAEVAKIRTNAESREFGMHKTTFTPKRPFKGKLSKKGFKRYFYANKYPAALWNEIAEQRKNSLLRKLALRGLSKQSWLKLAEVAGLTVKAPGFVKKIPLNISRNFSSRRIKRMGSYSINFRNAQPTVNRIGAKRIVRNAINGRVKYFERNMKLGVFDEIEKIAKAYPGLMRAVPSVRGTMQ